MKTTVERTSGSEAVLNVELEWAELEKASDRAYRKLAQKYTVPGFRRGHAPRSMLERMLGKEAIYQEGLEEVIETSYRDAIREHALTPLAQPDLDAPPLEMGQPYAYVARVPVLAPVDLGDYRSVRVEQPSTEVTDADVDAVLAQVQQEQAMWLPAERPAQIGDKVVVDLKLVVGERVVSDLHDNEYELTSERVGIFTGMDEHVVGMSEGETREFTTTIPEDYANSELAGKEAQYTVTLKGVKYRELPELDDELAKSVGDYDSFEALRGAVREQLASQKRTEASRTLRDRAVQAVAEQASVDVHPVLVSEELDSMLNETNRLLQQNRISLEQYLAMTQKSEEEYRKELEPEALERVKKDLVLDAVADAEGITASDQEIQSWLDLLAAMGGNRLRLKQLTAGQRASIARRIRRDKAIGYLVEITTEGQTSAAEDAAGGTAAEDAVSGAMAAAAAGADSLSTEAEEVDMPEADETGGASQA